MITLIVIGALVTYLGGAGATLYACRTYDFGVPTRPCYICTGVNPQLTSPYNKGETSQKCVVCESTLSWKNAYLSTDHNEIILATTALWPLMVTISLILRRSDRVRNARIKERLELTSSEEEIQKLLTEGRK